MKTQLQFDRFEGNSSYFVNPLTPTDRLRIGVKNSSKNLTDGQKVPSVNVTFNQVRTKEVGSCKDNCNPARETVGISIEINTSQINSGSIQNEWNVLKEQVDAALSRGILRGLKPAQNAEFFMYDADSAGE